MVSEVYECLHDLKKIKKEYGEEMSNMCRELFPTILEKPGLLYYIISTRFAKSKLLFEDIINEGVKHQFKNYIYFIYDMMTNLDIKKESFNNKKVHYESARKLLKDKGYTLIK